MNNKKATPEELLEAISKKLDKILGVLAIQGKDVITQINILHGIGLEWDEIGRYVGLTANAARKRYERKNE
ncbi:MAG: hypothetical protein KGI10_07010 [Thaumarchaeota archaeon]|nr:hypothetical protein [Nitrososphaerota archaeon]